MKLTELKNDNKNKQIQKHKLYLDLDGVLVDFKKAAANLMNIPRGDFPSSNHPKDKEFDNKLWKAVRKHIKEGKPFWSNMDKLPDADDLWNYVKQYDPEILTATGDHFKLAKEEKQKWVKQNLGPDVVVNVTSRSEEKSKFAKPNDVLIDDREQSINPWIAAGGIGILHTSASNTIKQLKKLGI